MPIGYGLQPSWTFGKGNVDPHRLESPLNRQLDRVSGLVLEQRADHRLPFADLLQIDRGHDIADLDSRGSRRTLRFDILDAEPILNGRALSRDDLIIERSQS